jgi:hypothetical protein
MIPFSSARLVRLSGRWGCGEKYFFINFTLFFVALIFVVLHTENMEDMSVIHPIVRHAAVADISHQAALAFAGAARETDDMNKINILASGMNAAVLHIERQCDLGQLGGGRIDFMDSTVRRAAYLFSQDPRYTGASTSE